MCNNSRSRCPCGRRRKSAAASSAWVAGSNPAKDIYVHILCVRCVGSLAASARDDGGWLCLCVSNWE